MIWRRVTSLIAILLGAAISHAGLASADTLHGTFTFAKKAPQVALIYWPEDTSLPTSRPTVIDQQNKQFTQKLYVAPQGGHALFKNSDSISHNIFVNDKKAGVQFDIGLMQPGDNHTKEVEWNEKVVRCGCKIHPKMKSWVASISSRYYKIIEFKKGQKEFQFSMNTFPEHLTKVKVWMPKYKEIELSIASGASKKVDLEKKGKPAGALTLTRN